MAGLFVLLWLFINVLQTEKGQTWLAHRAAAYLSSELKTTIRIDRLRVHFGTSVDLYGLYVEDLHHDTLFYADEFTVKIREMNTRTKALALRKVTLKNAFFNLTSYHGEKHDNIAFIIDYFSSGKTEVDTAVKPWQVKFDKVTLENVHFIHNVEDDSAYVSIVDFSHLDVRNIFGNFDDVHFEGDSAFVKIEKLRFHDQSGFRLDELSAVAKVAPDEMRLQGLVITTPTTDIHTDLTFNYDDFSCFDDFLTCIRFKSDFRNSKVSFTDIAYFEEDVKTMKLDVNLTGNFRGTVSNFKGKNVDIRFGSKSYIRGDVAMNGLPDIDETFMEINARELRTNKKDIEDIRLPDAEPDNRIILPSNTAHLGTVNFKGRFTGFINDFVAYGNMSTAIGYVSSDINLKYNERENLTYYSGHISTKDFNVGKFFSLPDFGAATFSADVNGKSFNIDRMDTKLDGVIGSMVYRNYDYRNMVVNARIAKKLFNGSVAIHEPNIDLDFNGSINFTQKLPEFNFTADLKSLQFDKLNLLEYKKDANLSTKAEIHLTGDKLDNLTGTISLSDINYRVEKVLYHVNNLSLSSSAENASRTIAITSDNVDADFHGQFELATLGDAFSHVIPHYLPSVIMTNKPVSTHQDFDFNIRIRNASLLTSLLMPGWFFDANTTLKGSFNSAGHQLNFKMLSSSVKYNNLELRNVSFHGNSDEISLNIILEGNRIYYSDSGYMEQPMFKAMVAANKITFATSVADSTLYENKAYLHGDVLFNNLRRFELTIDSSNIVVNNSAWYLDKKNKVLFDSSDVTFQNVAFSKAGESISFNGTLSKDSSEKITASLFNFNMENLNPFLRNSGTVFKGTAEGKVFFQESADKSMMLQSDLVIDSLILNGDSLGHAVVHSSFDNIDKELSINATIQRGTTITLIVIGKYYTARKEDNLDFDITMKSVYLNTFSQYVGNVIADLRGKLSADLHLGGKPEKPVFTGAVHFTKAGCTVNYLGTRYSFTDDVKVEENQFVLKNFSINDEFGKTAFVNGTIRHDYFKNFVFNVDLRATNFECLNTHSAENSVYYGRAIASGYATFKGLLDNMNINIALTSNKGTLISIPLGSSEEVSRNEYVRFIKFAKGDEDEKEEKRFTNLSGVNLNMAFDATPDAEIKLIFDEKIGDIIYGYGNGNIRMVITDDGTFRMYGNYIIDKGTYLFTMRNVINKRFEIEKGGTISWYGDPYDADINLDATYRLYTSTLYNLLQDSTYRRRLPIDCKINLSNKLMNPTIHYTIEVPGLDATAQSQVSSVLNSEAEVSKQFFGLMMLNQFIPAGTSNQFAYNESIGSSASELLSNQVSNWLSQLNLGVGLGVNYRPRNEISNEQVEVMISKSILKDRVIIEGNVGNTHQNNTTQNAGNVYGDFNAEYKVSADGRFRIRAFNKSNEYNILYNNAPYTQGLGVFYREEFNNLKELLKRWKLIREKQEKKTEEKSSSPK